RPGDDVVDIELREAGDIGEAKRVLAQSHGGGGAPPRRHRDGVRLRARGRRRAHSGVQRLVRRSGLLARLSPRLAQLDALMPEVGWRLLTAPSLPPRVPAVGPEPVRARVSLLAGCVQRVFFPGVAVADALD